MTAKNAVRVVFLTAWLGFGLTLASSASALCPGDCNEDNAVTVDEVLIGVTIALESQTAAPCEAFDANGNDGLEVNELVGGVDSLIVGCPATPTPTDTETATATPSDTETPTATSTPTPTATMPLPTPPGELNAGIDDALVRLNWSNATGANALLLRRLNEAPAGPDDPEAARVYYGSDDETTEDLTLLLPDTAALPRTYHYTVYACTSTAACETVGSSATLTPTISQVLQAGSYSIYFRHAMANVCQDCSALGTAAETTFPDWWKSCDSECVPAETCATAERSTPRQMSAQGVMDAQTIGTAFRDRDFPVGRVVSSEYCRCVQTAENMDLGPTIETNQGITFFVYDEANRCTHSLELIAERPSPGTNNVIIGHAGFTTCPTEMISFLQMGDGAIYKPDGDAGSTFIAIVQPAQWATLP